MANPTLASKIASTAAVNGDGCWVWPGFLDRDGYGFIKVSGKSQRVHRASYEAHKGGVPGGLVVRHNCDNPSCVNPAHLEAGTQAENMADMASRGRRSVQAGAKNNGAKISHEMAVAVFLSPLPAADAAKAYGVARKNISAIRRGKSWVSATAGLQPPAYMDGRHGQ